MSSSLSPTSSTDIVSLSALRLTAAVGPDGWHRTRPQPISLTVHLHLSPSYLDTPGQSDDVTDSVHYGHLAKAVERRVVAQTENQGGYASARALAEDVTDAALTFVRDAADAVKKASVEVVHAVRIVVELPKQILLAGGFEVDLTTCASDWTPWSGKDGQGTARVQSQTGAIVRVANLILPVLIGVNPPERLAKQRVVTHLTFYEAARTNVGSLEGTEAPGVDGQEIQEIDYPAVVQQIATDIENSAHLTLERLVYQVIHTAYRACGAHPHHPSSDLPRIDAITVRCQKPSALSFADASGVEMTRTREALPGCVGN